VTVTSVFLTRSPLAVRETSCLEVTDNNKLRCMKFYGNRFANLTVATSNGRRWWAPACEGMKRAKASLPQ